MEGNLLEAVKLMVVGMATVFAVLFIIIGVSNALIAFVNKFIGEDEKPAAQSASQPTAVNPSVAQAIAQAVNIATAGKAKVDSIKPL
ncbi:MAG: OadG family transporter subunit [Bacteroidia bacterium]|nr:OadG family transporter subunit [Bacteroidia bacterium]